MKIIEAMKEIKRLQEKASDLRKKVAAHSADLDFETAVYPDQKRQVDEWIQSHSDTLSRILDLRVAIQETNLKTVVAIELDGKHVSKTIAAWVHRRRDLAKLSAEMYAQLTDKNLKEGRAQQSAGNVIEVKIRRYYDPVVRDKMLALYRDEPSIIDGTLEVVNAVTDVVGI